MGLGVALILLMSLAGALLPRPAAFQREYPGRLTLAGGDSLSGPRRGTAQMDERRQPARQ